jgi:hypothetical protein
MLTTVSDPCETGLSPFEDRYADVSTFRTISGGREARARLSFFWRESAARYWNGRRTSPRSRTGTASTPSTCSATA